MDSLYILNRIKLILKIKGITQKEVIEKCKLNHNTFTFMKSHTPTLENVKIIAEYLDISIDYLVGRTEDMYSHKK